MSGGVKATDDFGQIVFNLVNGGVLGKNETDSPSDFKNVFSFDDRVCEAFCAPALSFCPPRVNRRGRRSRSRSSSAAAGKKKKKASFALGRGLLVPFRADFFSSHPFNVLPKFMPHFPKA